MPYISKYYSCEQIDERLKQGYYNDFVDAGFEGTLKEFLNLVLTIKDKIDSSEVNELLDQLRRDLEKLISEGDGSLIGKLDQYKEEFEGKIQETHDAIPTLVSQLENDKEYQTKQQVEEYISNLVDGADKSLDTLVELANALNNDPNFAANVTNLITQLRTDLNNEIERAKEVEKFLNDKLESEISKREIAHNEIRELIESTRNSWNEALQNALTQFDNKFTQVTTKLSEFELSLESTRNDLVQSITTNRTEVDKAIHDLEDKINDNQVEIKTYVNEKVQEEADRAKDKESEISEALTQHKLDTASSINELKNSDLKIASDITAEITTRQSEDAKLQSAIQDEATKRASDKVEILGKISEEVTNRANADTQLQTKIETEITNRQQADRNLDSKIDTESTNRINEDNLIRQEITHNKELTDAAIKKVADDLAAETARAIQVEDSKVDKKEGYTLSKNDFTDELLNKLNSISDHANNVTKVSELINDSNFQTQEEVEQLIQDLIGAAPDTLNTLKELADALGNDPNFAATLTQSLTQLGTQLNQEIADRKQQKEDITTAYTQAIQNAVTQLNAAYTNLANNLNTLDTTLSKDIEVLRKDVDDLEGSLEDILSRQDAKIQGIRSEVVEKTNALNTALTDLRSETKDDIAKWSDTIQNNTTGIQKNLDLIQELQGQITGINTNIKDSIELESQKRQSADDQLQANIDQVSENLRQESLSREQADNTLQTNIDNESTTREAEDSKLRDRIIALETALEKETQAREAIEQAFNEYKDQMTNILNDIYNIIKLS